MRSHSSTAQRTYLESTAIECSLAIFDGAQEPVFTLVLIESGDGGIGDSDVDQSQQDQQQTFPKIGDWVRRCPSCSDTPQIIRSFLDPGGGKTVRLMECKCGERIWSGEN